ncbi:hypothetical protein Tco_1081646 [Tanacetum coccineum]|uniref:Uncharacterized protein n=1 Tax=Tanacetum coccineum TaxID=301880 RepID=A0ABQ5HZB1_9ASTR
MKKLTLTSYTPYPSRKIRRICDCTSQETTKEQSSIRRIQETSICRIQDKEIKYSGIYQTWSLLQETPDTPYLTLSMRQNKKSINVGIKRLLSVVKVTAAGYGFYCW